MISLGWMPLAILAAGPAQAGDPCACSRPSFGPAPRTFTTGTVAADVGVVTDVTGDGHLDFVLSTRSLTGVVTTLPGDGDVNLGGPIVSDIGSGGSQAIVAADFDEDGRLDVAMAGGYGDPFVTTALGDGAGSFTFAWSAFVGVNPSSLAAADFDGDDHLDLAVTASDSSQIAVLRGSGDGTFVAPTFVPTAIFATDVIAADWNQDGVVDLAYREPSSGAVRVRLGDGTGAFGPALLLDAGGSARDLRTADLDRDGHLDFVATRPFTDTVVVLRALGGGAFAPRAEYPALEGLGLYALGDLDADGHLDLVGSYTNVLDGHLSVMRGSPGAGFLPPVKAVLGVHGQVHLADFDRDGRLDAGVVGGPAAFVAPGRGDGTFLQPPRIPTTTQPRRLEVADMNGDARPDLVVAQLNGVAVRLHNGAGGLGAPLTIGLQGTPRTLNTGDLDGDSDIDLVVEDVTGVVTAGIRVLLNDGNGSLSLGEFDPAGVNATGSALGDLDSDGHLDAVVNESTNFPRLWLFRGGGNGTFAPAGTVPLAGKAPNFVVTADLNGDTDVDVVVGHAFTGDIEVLLGVGAGGLGPGTLYPNAGGAVAVADANGDGIPDLISGKGVLIGTGTGAFLPQVLIPEDSRTALVIPTDLNGDGHLDLVGAHSPSVVCTLVGHGDGTFSQFQAHVPVSGIMDIALLDLDGDARLDILAASGNSNEVAWLRNTSCEPRRLRVVTDVGGPASTGEPFPQQPQIEMQDDGGNRLSCATGEVAAALVPGTGTPGALLQGDVTSPLVLGRATFTDLAIDRGGAGYEVAFDHRSVDAKRSHPIDVGPPAVALADVQVAEGTGGSVIAPFRFTLSGPSGLPVSMSYATRAGTATAGSDYQSVSGTLTFAPGATEAFANVVVLSDASPEPDEHLYLDASAPANATLEHPTGRGRILDDDGGAFVLSEISHGTEISRTLTAALVPRHLYLLVQQPRASYEAIVDAASGDLGSGAGPGLRRLASDLTTVMQESSPEGTGPSRRLAWEHVAAGPVESEYVEVRSLGCTLACGIDDSYRLRFRETTGFIPRFNSAGGQTSVVLLQNPTARPVSGHAWFWSPAGALLADVAFDLTPRGGRVIATGAVPGLEGAAGSVTVSHDGGLGGLVGKAVSLEAASGFSFDTPMVFRAR